MTLIYVFLVVLVGSLFLGIGSSQIAVISLAALAIVVAFIIDRFRNSQAWLFALIASSLWAIEESFWAFFRLTNTSNILITDILYFSGAFIWLLALIKMRPKMTPSKNFIFALPLISLALWLSWQSWSVESNISLIVELVLFLASLPLVFASMQGKAHEGRILWVFGFYIRLIATALLGWLAPESSSSHLFFLIFGLSYGFIAVGILLELTKSKNNIVAIIYSVISLELLTAVILIIFHQLSLTGSITGNLIVLSFAYFLLIAVLALIYSDREKRLGAEIQLKNYSNLLEHILSYKTKEAHSDYKLEELEQGLFKITKASFPSLTGLKIIRDSGKESIFGQTDETTILVKAENEVVGSLYFKDNAQNLDLIKNIAPLLGNYIKTTLNHFSAQTEAMTDPLTKILNRRGFDSQSQYLIAQAKMHLLPITVVLIDIDHFKAINDKYGHHIGDQVLTTFSSVIRQNIRSFDLFVRWGGEEFLIIFYDADIKKTEIIIKRIYEDLRVTNFKHLAEPPSFSAGITGGHVPSDVDLEKSLAKADQAMYIAKQTGRNKHVVLN